MENKGLKPRLLYLERLSIKMGKLKDKERIIKAMGDRQLVTYKEAPINLSADFSTETFQT